MLRRISATSWTGLGTQTTSTSTGTSRWGIFKKKGKGEKIETFRLQWAEQLVNQGKCILHCCSTSNPKVKQRADVISQIPSFWNTFIKSISNVGYKLLELLQSERMLIKQRISGNPNIGTKYCGCLLAPHWFNLILMIISFTNIYYYYNI